MKEQIVETPNKFSRKRIVIKIFSSVVVLAVLLVVFASYAMGKGKKGGVNQKSSAKRVLIYTKNGKGYVHKNIPYCVACMERICKKHGWSYEVSNDPGIFTWDKIKTFDALIFANTNNEAFDNDSQRKVFQKYIHNGGGFMGIHSASGSERHWPWFWANLGGKFLRHAPLNNFEIKVIDRNNPSTSFLGKTWKWKDECYYLNNLNPDIHVLLAADLRTVKDKGKAKYPGDVFGNYFPLCWCQEFEGGRQWYTALGHSPEFYSNPVFVRHLEGGLIWVLDKKQAKRWGN